MGLIDGIKAILGVGAGATERLVRVAPGSDGRPDRLVYEITGPDGATRLGWRERIRTAARDRCPRCGGLVREAHAYDEVASEAEGCATWVATGPRCEACGWEPTDGEPCVDWYLGEMHDGDGGGE